VQFLASAIPLMDSARLELPYEKRCAGELDETKFLPQALLAGTQGLLHAPPLRDVDERNDHPVDLVVYGPVRTEPHQIPTTVSAGHLALDRHQIPEDLARVHRQFVVAELMREIGYRPAQVVDRDIEQFRESRSKPLDPQTGIQEQSSEVARGHQILEV